MSAPEPGRNLRRSIGAVALGFFTTFILSVVTDAALHAVGFYPAVGQPSTDGALAVALVYRTLFTVLGGALTARLAPHQPMRHAVWLAVIGQVLSIVGAAATWNAGPAFGPHWFPVALAVLAMPSVLAGAKLVAGRGAQATALPQ